MIVWTCAHKHWRTKSGHSILLNRLVTTLAKGVIIYFVQNNTFKKKDLGSYLH